MILLKKLKLICNLVFQNLPVDLEGWVVKKVPNSILILLSLLFFDVCRKGINYFRDREKKMVFLSKVLKGGPDYATVPESWKPETWKLSNKGTPFEKVEQNLARNNLRKKITKIYKFQLKIFL